MADLYPVAKFHFKVSFSQGGTISFQEVSGLDQEAEMLEYRTGHVKSLATMKRAGLVKTSTVSFKKGIFTKDDVLTKMFDKMYKHKYHGNGNDKFINSITVLLMNDKGEKIMGWKIKKAIPLKFAGTDMNSNSSEVAIETMEFAHTGIEII